MPRDKRESKQLRYAIVGLVGFVLYVHAGLSAMGSPEGLSDLGTVEVLLATAGVLYALVGFIVSGIADMRDEKQRIAERGKSKLEKTFE